ncbi:MAG: HpcH/HpaI aldolase/citrate lyase family protein [Pirellulales bacterium]
MKPNATKAKLKAGQTVHGLFVRYPDASLAEVLGYQPWDFLMFDGEHGTLEPRDAEHLVRAAELRGVTPIIRVPTNQPHVILRLLDSGAGGLHVPWVNTAAEAEAAVRSVKYHPRGIRGLAGVRAADFGQAGPLADYVKHANAESLVVIHIETIDAVRQLPEIVGIDGIDVIFIGPTDLSHSLGAPGQPQHPDVQAAMQQIVDIVAPTDKALGILVPTADAARQWRDRGARYIATTLESLLSPAAAAYLRAARD